ncbi:MAG TPA: hypothetical protein VK698_39695 [Kofleriaceae bacterium]|nr:hypothetical protein [Kofleriaceae bacterium]
MTQTMTNLGTVTYNGEPLALVESSWNSWTADGITLHILPTGLWGASRTGSYPTGADTPQEALDNLVDQERKAARAATIRAGLTDGQRFARDMRRYLAIGATTRRYRKGADLHAEILRLGMELVTSGTEYGYSEDLINAIRPAFGALRSYDSHITTGRLGGLICQYINAMSPWQLLDLLAEMTDAGITHTGGGERWLQDLAKTLVVADVNALTGRQTIRRAA